MSLDNTSKRKIQITVEDATAIITDKNGREYRISREGYLSHYFDKPTAISGKYNIMDYLSQVTGILVTDDGAVSVMQIVVRYAFPEVMKRVEAAGEVKL